MTDVIVNERIELILNRILRNNNCSIRREFSHKIKVIFSHMFHKFINKESNQCCQIFLIKLKKEIKLASRIVSIFETSSICIIAN